MLTLKKYYLEYQNKKVFDNTSFFARNGQVTLITGESGSGKTTLLHTLCFHTLFSGEYSYNDVVLSSLSEQEKQFFYSEKICMIEQFPSFLKDLTIRNHFNLFDKEIDDECLENIMNQLNISKLMNEYPNQLSGGEKKRISLCLAMMRNTQILIIDEPTASLNEEYTEVVCQLLREYAKEGHCVIVSSHDTNMKEYADSIWKIDYQKIEQIKDNEKEKNKNHQPKKINIKFKEIILMFFSHIRRKYLSFIIISILIAFIGVSYQFNNIAISTHKGIVNELSSREILVYKSSDTGLFDYSQVGQEIPLTENEVKRLQNIKELTNIEWRYDNAFKSRLDENIDLYFPEELESINNELKVTKNNQEIISGIKDYEDNLGNTLIKTYTPNVNIDSNVEKVYGKEGIYLSQQFASILTEKNIDILDGTSLQFPIYIPIYNVSGVTTWVSEKGEEFECNAIATKKVLVTLPIAGVLKGSSLYDTDTSGTGKEIFIPRSIYEEYISKYKKEKGTIIYCVYEGDTYKEYIDIMPNHKNVNLRQTIKAEVWEPNCYVAAIDNLENLESVLKQLHDLGLNAKSLYIDSSSLKESVESMQKSVQMAGGVIFIILCLVGYQNKKSNKETEKETNKFLKNIGLLPKEIKKFKIRKRLIYFINQGIISLVIGIGIIKVLNMMMYGNTNLSIIVVMIIIGTAFIIEFIFPTIIELKKEKR